MSTEEDNEHESCTSYEELVYPKRGGSQTMVDRQLQASLSDSESKSKSLNDNDVLTTLSRLKEKIGRLEMDRQEAESNMRKLANETLLFREQILCDQALYSQEPPKDFHSNISHDVPHNESASNNRDDETGLRDFEVTDNEDEFFIVSAREEDVVVDDHAFSNTLDIVEDRCIALEREFQTLREILSESDNLHSHPNHKLPSEEFHEYRDFPRQRDSSSGSLLLEKRLSELLGSDDGSSKTEGNEKRRSKPKRTFSRPQSATLTRTSLEGECMRLAQTKLQSHSKKRSKNVPSTRPIAKNSRSRSSNTPLFNVPAPKHSRQHDRPFQSALELKPSASRHDEFGEFVKKQPRVSAPRVDGDRAKARAIISELHREMEILKGEHKALAHRLAVESSHAKKALLVNDLDRIVNYMEQKGEQVGRLKSYMRRGTPSRIVVKPPKPFITGSSSSVPQPRETNPIRNVHKMHGTLSIGDVRWTSAI